ATTAQATIGAIAAARRAVVRLIGVGPRRRGIVPQHRVYCRAPLLELFAQSVRCITLAEHCMILIVDDFPDVGQALCRLLVKSGYPCQHVTSGPDALSAIRAHPREQPILVVLDLMMPQMDGVDCLRAIRADPAIAQ